MINYLFYRHLARRFINNFRVANFSCIILYTRRDTMIYITLYTFCVVKLCERNARITFLRLASNNGHILLKNCLFFFSFYTHVFLTRVGASLRSISRKPSVSRKSWFNVMSMSYNLYVLQNNDGTVGGRIVLVWLYRVLQPCRSDLGANSASLTSIEFEIKINLKLFSSFEKLIVYVQC